MIKEFDDAFRAAAQEVARAEADTRAHVGAVSGSEEEFSSVFASKIRERLDNKTISGLHWNVWTKIVPKKTERIIGADLLISVQINLPNAQISKGILMQAKVNSAKNLGLWVKDPGELADQCDRMRTHTNDSFVITYGNSGTSILKGATVSAVKGKRLSRLHRWGVTEFFHIYFRCDYGDPNMACVSQQDARRMVEELKTNLVMINVRTAEPDRTRIRARG